MLGLIPAVKDTVNKLPEWFLVGGLLTIGIILFLIALMVESKEIKAGALAYILIP